MASANVSAVRSPDLVEEPQGIFLKAMARPWHNELLQACSRIVDSKGERVSASAVETSYVIHGQTFVVATAEHSFSFWVGVNGRRLFFIANVNSDPARSEIAFEFCFGGAAKVGWAVNYQPIMKGTAIWATCMTSEGVMPDGVNCLWSVSESGLFWATDIAMMVQSWICTSQREGIAPHDTLAPAPL